MGGIDGGVLDVRRTEILTYTQRDLAIPEAVGPSWCGEGYQKEDFFPMMNAEEMGYWTWLYL